MNDPTPPPSVTADEKTLRVHDLQLRVDEATQVLSAIRSGEVDALVVSAPDEAPRVFLLKGADEAHRVLLETLNEGAMTVASDGTILYANNRFAEMIGRPLERVLGAPLTIFLAPADVAIFRRILGERRGDGKAEVTLLTDVGLSVPVMVSMRAVGAAHETYTVVVTDLTPLKEAQDALRRANDDLEARVLARTAEIARVNEALRAENAERTALAEELSRKAEELAAADRRKDDFLSMLAHELRNPLSPITTAVELLRSAGAADPRLERYRVIIERQTRNLTRLVEDLLDVSRITRGMIVLRKQPVALRTIVTSAVEAVRPHVEAAGHALSVKLPDEPAILDGDPTRMEQILVNLLNNAVKYTEPGGRITLSAEVAGGRLTLRVRDNGVGIGPELLPHVFELFVQGKRSLARSQGGLGVGLTLVKSLVDMHGGTIEAHSHGAGRGTEMILRLPLAVAARAPRAFSLDGATSGPIPPRSAILAPRAHSARANAPSQDSQSSPPQDSQSSPMRDSHSSLSGDGHSGSHDGLPSGSPEVRPPGPRVLVVEDNHDAAESLVELLEYWGFDVRSACDGEAALAAASEHRPHAALIDVGLPGIDGFQVARRLRALGIDTSLLIGLTGYGQERDRKLGADAGFDHYLVKPLDADVLQRILERASLFPRQPSSSGTRSRL